MNQEGTGILLLYYLVRFVVCMVAEALFERRGSSYDMLVRTIKWFYLRVLLYHAALTQGINIASREPFLPRGANGRHSGLSTFPDQPNSVATVRTQDRTVKPLCAERFTQLQAFQPRK